MVARLLILWVDESAEGRARSLSAEPREVLLVTAAGGAASRIASHDARSRNRGSPLEEATRRRGGARMVHQFTTVRTAYQRNSSFPSDRLARSKLPTVNSASLIAAHGFELGRVNAVA